MGIFFFIGRKVLSQYETASILFALFSLAVAYSTFLTSTGIYYTFWFGSLLGLLLLSVLSCILTLKFSLALRYISFIVLHGALFLVAAGLLLNSLTGRKCYLSLHRGQTVKTCHPIRHNEVLESEEDFPFPVKLLDFRVHYYSRGLVLGVFLKRGDKFKLIKTFPLKEGHTYFGLKFEEFNKTEVRVARLWGEGEKGRAPLGKIFPGGWAYSLQAFPGILAVVEGKKRLFYLPEQGQSIILPDAVVVIREFYRRIPGHSPPVEIPGLTLDVISARGKGRAFLTEGSRGISLGSAHIFYSLSSDMPMILKPDRTFTREKEIALSSAVFSYSGEKVVLYPFSKPLIKGKFAFRLFREPPQEREYVSLIQTGSRKFNLKVNHPASYGGFLFYQSDYNPSDPDFSGVMAVREPGSFLLYSGFVFLALGAVLTLIYRRKTWT